MSMSTPVNAFPALPQARTAETTAGEACAALEQKEEDIQRLWKDVGDLKASLAKLKRLRHHVAAHGGELRACLDPSLWRKTSHSAGQYI